MNMATSETTTTDTSTNISASVSEREPTRHPTKSTNTANIPAEKLNAAIAEYFKNNPPSIPISAQQLTMETNSHCNQTEPPRKKRRGNSLTNIFTQQSTNTNSNSSKPSKRKRKKRKQKSKSTQSNAPSSNSSSNSV